MSDSFVCRVSSTISRDVKSFGKQFMFDGNDETCWNSDEGLVQWVSILYEQPIIFSSIAIQFQGGFAAREFSVEVWTKGVIECSEIFTCEDINSMQTFKLSKCFTGEVVKLIFKEQFDTYGRIIIYHLKFM